MSAGLAPAAADEWAIRQLVERYASAADRADGDAVAALFTVDGELEVWLDPALAEPTGRRHGRTEIAAAIATLCRYDATQHDIASTVTDLDGDRASGVTHCTAHHLSTEGSRRSDRVMVIRYDDALLRTDDGWRFSRRELHVQWTSLQSVESS